MPAVSAKTIAQRISDFQKLVNQNQDYIREHGNSAWQKIGNGSEVHLVHEFLARKGVGNHYLNGTVGKRLRQEGWVVKFAGIFLHQKPMVRGFLDKGRFLLPKRCELGDLQTIFAHVGAEKQPVRTRSVIYQAKLKRAGGEYHVKHPQQRQLYDVCEGFNYETGWKGSRRFPETGREHALQYLFVAEDPVSVKTIPALSTGGAFCDYGEHLLRFLNNSTGLSFDAGDIISSWGGIVNDMIQLGAKANPAGRYTRQTGLEHIMNPFNAFESDDVVFLGPEAGTLRRNQQAEDGTESFPGYGIQVIIIWDGELRGDLPILPDRPLPRPKHLEILADLYATADHEDVNERNKARDELAEMMGYLSMPLGDILNAIDSHSGNEDAFIAAGAAAILTIVKGTFPDAAFVADWLKRVRLPCTALWVLRAIEACGKASGKTFTAQDLRSRDVHGLLDSAEAAELLERIEKGANWQPVQQKQEVQMRYR